MQADGPAMDGEARIAQASQSDEPHGARGGARSVIAPRPFDLLLVAAAAAGPLFYPAWLAWRTRNLKEQPRPEPASWPPLSVVVPAYRESAVISAKVRNVQENGYPGPLQILVVAEDEETANLAREQGAEVLSPSERLGKAGALNAGFAAAWAPIVVFTDANALLVEGSLTRMAAWFEDETIGAVAGEKRLVGGEHGQGLYWEYESWLKQHESLLGTTIGLVGELGALRRDLFRPLPDDVVVDDLWLALDVIEAGAGIRYEPTAIAEEHGSSGLSGEWERRTRVICGALDVLWRRRATLAGGPDHTSVQLWGHRLGRFAIGPVAHAGLLARALVFYPTSIWGRTVIALHTFFAGSVARWVTGAELSRIERASTLTLFLQATGVGGVLRYLRGDRPSRWPKADRNGSPTMEPAESGSTGDELDEIEIPESVVADVPRRRFSNREGRWARRPGESRSPTTGRRGS